MTRNQKILVGLLTYLGLIIVVVLLFGGWHKVQNNTFHPQNEFRLDTWFSIGPIKFNKAVLYLILAGLLTVGTTLWLTRKLKKRPNRAQAGFEFLYTRVLKEMIMGDTMDEKMAAKWFPFIATLFLFILFSNLLGYIPLPTNTQEKINIGIAHIPAFSLYASTASLSIPLVLAIVVFVSYTIEGVRKKGPGGYLKGLVPEGIHGFAAVPLFILELFSNLMRLLSLSIRLFANILAGHLIILFMAGALAVLLGISAIGVITLPIGIAIYMFEVVLIAGLQAFIFATLTAIYLGGAVAESH
jgi:F-type H+-transporting ATPase subunit a